MEIAFCKKLFLCFLCGVLLLQGGRCRERHDTKRACMGAYINSDF